MTIPPPKAEDSRHFYESLAELYPMHDRWHRVTHKWIARIVRRETATMWPFRNASVLNVGSGGESFFIPEDAILHVDLHAKGFNANQRLLVADIENLPNLEGSFDLCLCVGSVINHCDAAAAIASMARELRSGGHLILEFESSYSLEFVGTSDFKKSATVVRTCYQGRNMSLWVYSPIYIRGLLKTFGFNVKKAIGKHYISPAIYRLWPSANFAAHFHHIDPAAQFVPLLRRHSHNIIFVCQKF